MRRCPSLVRVKPRMDVYRQVSAQVFDVFRRYSPIVEGLSLDEAFIDVSDSLKLFGDGERIAAQIKKDVLAETGLTASVGVAPNKLVAKIASDLDKPDGLVVVPASRLRDTLDPLPAGVIPGIGRETLSKLERIGVHTIHDLRTADDSLLRPVFGRYTDRTRSRAEGVDDRPVVPEREEKSISAEQTFGADLEDAADMDAALLSLSERAAARMRRAALKPSTITVKIRESDFTTCTRQRSLTPPSNATGAVYAAARVLLHAWLAVNPGARIRLLGVGGSRLGGEAQQDLFAGDTLAAPDDVDRTVDEIRERFGAAALGRARTLDRRT
jgi:DNA polymerase-4